MKLINSVIVLLMLNFSTGLSQTLVMSKNFIFGDGFLNHSKSEKSNEDDLITFFDQKQDKLWSKSIPKLQTFDNEWVEDYILEDVFVADEHSNFAYYAFFNNKINTLEIGQINLEGTILKKNLLYSELFPFQQKKDLIQTYFSFVSENKFYLVFQKKNEKIDLEFNYYLVEIDESLNYKLVDLPNSKVLVKDWNNGIKSKPRYIASDKNDLIYGTWIKSENNGYEFQVTKFDLLNKSIKSEHQLNLPIIQTEKDFIYLNNSPLSYSFKSGVQVRNDWKFYKQVKTEYMAVPDIGSYFAYYYLKGELFIWGTKKDDNEISFFSTNTALTNEKSKNLSLKLLFFNTLKKPNGLSEKTLSFPPTPFFNENKKDFIFTYIIRNGFEDYDFHYYSIENNGFHELLAPSNAFMPTAFFAANFDYLKQNGVYNFPEVSAWEIKNNSNIDVKISDDKVLITYYKTKTETMKMVNYFQSLGSYVYIYSKE
jgi:hypothetical protein